MPIATPTRTLPARDDFPLVSTPPACLYLNASFQMPLSKTVRDAAVAVLDAHMTEDTPKPAWFDGIASARQKMADHMHAPVDSIAFTKNTSQSSAVDALID